MNVCPPGGGDVGGDVQGMGGERIGGDMQGIGGERIGGDVQGMGGKCICGGGVHFFRLAWSLAWITGLVAALA
jgi:hypothetical protein